MSAEMRLVWLTISIALERSIIKINERSKGQGWLKPRAILCARGRGADTAEWLGRNHVGWVKEEVS